MASLRWRLLAVTLVALLAALVAAGVGLHTLFRDHVMQQFQRDLTVQLDQLTARLAVDASGQPTMDAAAFTDPRWQQPYGGLYWQIDRPPQAALLRSRSLWDAVLRLPADSLANGAVHVHHGRGPGGQPLLMLERSVRLEGAPPLRLIVAANSQPTLAAIGHFRGVLAASLAVLALLLGGAAVAQVVVGLAPLHALTQAVQRVREGRAQRVEGRFPAEVQPLIDDFNSVLASRTEWVARARAQAGNLAHAVKTPLAVLQQAASTPGTPPADLRALVQEQVQRAREQVDWHLARTRAAATHGLPGQRTAVAPVLQGLVRVMRQVHAERALTVTDAPTSAHFAGEAQDLQDMLGNLLDNACKWAATRVAVQAEAQGRELHICVTDDGPGIAPEQRATARTRGARLDEAVPGTGLGLAIVDELAALYGGRLLLDGAPGGGLAATLVLPLAA